VKLDLILDCRCPDTFPELVRDAAGRWYCARCGTYETAQALPPAYPGGSQQMDICVNDDRPPADLQLTPLVRVRRYGGLLEPTGLPISAHLGAGPAVPISGPPLPGPAPRRSAVRLFDDHGNQLVLTSRLLLNLVGFLRSRMADDGEINVAVDPPMGLIADVQRRVLRFVFETPHQEFDYSPAEAGKLWRAIKDACCRF
jgi:hypothetical protein